jgi:hypothetical protein
MRKVDGSLEGRERNIDYSKEGPGGKLKKKGEGPAWMTDVRTSVR